MLVPEPLIYPATDRGRYLGSEGVVNHARLTHLVKVKVALASVVVISRRNAAALRSAHSLYDEEQDHCSCCRCDSQRDSRRAGLVGIEDSAPDSQTHKGACHPNDDVPG